ncbi:hypothetical protein M2150_001699 [Lachnospiraceae bacterium PM6-15]|uniref:hypothetical protein n=1 Tax=Ohessyouella blattaphilus TaxID=2949333 RepID=UPI003E1B296F
MSELKRVAPKESVKNVTAKELRSLVSNLEDGVVLVVWLEEKGGIEDVGNKRR